MQNNKKPYFGLFRKNIITLNKATAQIDASQIIKFLVYFFPFSIEIVLSSGTIKAGIIKPIPAPIGFIVVNIEVIITLYLSENHVPLIFAGELIIKGCPIPPINPENKQIQNPA